MNISSLKTIFLKIEDKIASMKFAVIIISFFTLLMIIGTFVESFAGTDYVNRLIYKTPLFMGTQLLMFLSILFAAFKRLPPKKRLYGFYTIHSGLIMIGIGSYITYTAGVDGSIFLPPNSPERQVILSDDEFIIYLEKENKQVSFKLPYTPFSKDLNEKYENITLRNYYPFADELFSFKKESRNYPGSFARHTSRYQIYNDMVAEELTLSLHPEAPDFKSRMQLGPLNVHYLPTSLASCFRLNNASGIIVWNSSTQECYTPESKKIEIKKTDSGKRFFVLPYFDRYLSFFPDQTPWPLSKDLKTIDKSSPMRVFSKNVFENGPHLFLFGGWAAFFDKDSTKWLAKEFKGKSSVELPWMGFQIKKLHHENKLVPYYKPVPITPVQENGALVKGQIKALELEVKGKKYWVTNQKPLRLLVDGKKISFAIKKESLQLPFEFVLTKFKMDTDPGTRSAASYESFVKVFTKEGPLDAHIFMNNPLKYDGFTFYQASYAENQDGTYSSTLSVNVDQGRPLKYLGSIFLVLGAFWHFLLNRKNRGKKENALVANL